MAETKERETKPQSATTTTETIPGGQVAVLGKAQVSSQPPLQSASVYPQRDSKSPYKSATEIVTGGCYISGGTYRSGQHYGGKLINANGQTLATFAPDQVNTGCVEDGTPPVKD